MFWLGDCFGNNFKKLGDFFKTSGHPGYNFHTDLIVLPSSVLLAAVALNGVMLGSVLMVVVLLSVILLSVV